jgi:membrane protease YdiL (CAAX protease family)
MTYLIILGALALVPLLAILLLRVNGAIAFMSLCVGSVLVSYTSPDVTSVVSSLNPRHTLQTNQWVQLGLLVIPFLLTILFTRGSVHGGKRFTNVLPALASGLLFALLITPLLSSGVQHQLEHQTAWRQLSNAQTAVVLGGAAFSLLFLLFTHRTRKPDEAGKKHGKH